MLTTLLCKVTSKVWIVSVALILFAPTASKATTTSFALGSNPSQNYTAAGNPQESAGPYPGTLIVDSVVSSFTLFFCLDGNLTASFNTSPAYSGTVAVPNTAQLEEAAFLASWALAKGAPSSNTTIVNTVEGPITYAIWQIMGTLGSLNPDPAAQSYVQTAIYAFNHNLLTSAYLSSVEVFSPTTGTTQRFIAAVRNDTLVNSALPEPSTVIFLATGLALIAAGRLRRRK